jgi:hypothetical protein
MAFICRTFRFQQSELRVKLESIKRLEPMGIKALNLFRTRDATLNLDHVLAISTGEADASGPGVDITMRGDHHHYAYFELQSEADDFFNRVVEHWQAVKPGVVVFQQVAVLSDAIFSIQPVGEHVVILFHHSEHRVRVGSSRHHALYEGLVGVWEASEKRQS